jgi:hypothetical protein
MPLTIIPTDGERRAIVSATADGATVAFYRAIYDNGGHPSWAYRRTSSIPQPFHVALDIAHRVIEAG